METIPVIAGLVAAFLTAKLLFRWFFEDADDFWECVRFAFTPDLFSLFKGEFFEDKLKSLKLSLFIFVMGGAGALTYSGLEEWLGSHQSASIRPAQPPSAALPAEKPE